MVKGFLYFIDSLQLDRNLFEVKFRCDMYTHTPANPRHLNVSCAYSGCNIFSRVSVRAIVSTQIINHVFCRSTVRTRPSRSAIVEEAIGREENRRREDKRGTEEKRRGTDEVRFSVHYQETQVFIPFLRTSRIYMRKCSHAVLHTELKLAASVHLIMYLSHNARFLCVI